MLDRAQAEGDAGKELICDHDARCGDWGKAVRVSCMAICQLLVTDGWPRDH